MHFVLHFQNINSLCVFVAPLSHVKILGSLTKICVVPCGLCDCFYNEFVSNEIQVNSGASNRRFDDYQISLFTDSHID